MHMRFLQHEELQMKSNTVFGHLALHFTVHPENLATEALAFILQNSPAASVAFSKFIRLAGIACPETLRFDSQQAGLENSKRIESLKLTVQVVE